VNCAILSLPADTGESVLLCMIDSM